LADGALDSSFARREGVALLMVGNPAAAINRLEAGLHDGQDRELLAELGAARIELALARDHPYGLVQALDDLERAKRSGRSISLDYNRALVLALLNLRGPAWEAWTRVRDGDDDPGWRNDAEMWLVKLSRPTIAEEWQRNVSRFRTWLLHGEGDSEAAVGIVRRHPQHARILAEEEGFAAWAAAVGSSRHEVAAAVASRLVMLGRELSTVSGDPLLSRSAEAVAACDERTCAALSEGHRRYTLARRLHESQDYAAAEVLFVESFEDLVRARSPFAFWPAFYRTIVIAHRPDFDRAAREFRSLLDDSGATGPIARAYLHWMLGYVALRQSEYGAALGELELARDLFRTSGEAENEQEMENQLGRIWDAVGKPERAWRHHFRALSLLGRSVKSRRIENTLSAAATGLRNRGEHAAAVVLQEACVAQAKSRGREVGVALALRYKAQSLDGLGDERAALRSVEEGLEWAQRIPDEGLRADTSAHLLLTWGAIARSELPRALENVEKAIQFAKRHKVRYLLPEGYATEAALRRELGDFAGEGRALEAAVEEIERQRRALTDEEQRLGFAATTRRVMEQGAVSLSDRGRWAESFAFADRLRARALWDAVTPSSGEIRELQRQSLADGEAVLSFLVLPDRILGWLVRADAVAGFEVPIGRAELEDLVQGFRRAARGDEPEELLRLRRRLSDLLLSQVRSNLGGLERLIVVPDGPLEELPFATLEGAGGGYLVESSAVTTVPAAALYPILSSRAQRPTTLSRWLLVADPAHSTTAFPALGRMTAGGSLIERQSRGRGRDVKVLTGEAATPAAFLKAAQDADVVVYLGHALAPTAFSTRAGLVLAPGEGDGLLHMRDVRFADQAHPRLVILAGCGTGRGRATAADGSVTIGRSFLRAGVPEVVATLWDVDSAGARKMTRLLLAAIAEGREDPLRVAQRQAMDSGAVPPSVWMAFQSIGGGG
jgi:CHAT domain-containing protein